MFSVYVQGTMTYRWMHHADRLCTHLSEVGLGVGQFWPSSTPGWSCTSSPTMYGAKQRGRCELTYNPRGWHCSSVLVSSSSILQLSPALDRCPLHHCRSQQRTKTCSDPTSIPNCTLTNPTQSSIQPTMDPTLMLTSSQYCRRVAARAPAGECAAAAAGRQAVHQGR